MIDVQGPNASICSENPTNFFNVLWNSVSNQNVHKILSSITFYDKLIAGLMLASECNTTFKPLFIGQTFDKVWLMKQIAVVQYDEIPRDFK